MRNLVQDTLRSLVNRNNSLNLFKVGQQRLRAAPVIICLLFVSLVAATAISVLPAHAAGAYPAGFTESLVAGGLKQPVAMEFAPDGRLFITEKGGTIRIIKNGNLNPEPFAQLAVDTTGERGVIGVTVDPNIATNGYVYVHYTTAASAPGGIHGRVSRLTASANNPDVMAPGSEKVLVDNIPSPAAYHEGGDIHFGLDGKLYAAIGNGGSTVSASQDLSTLSGKLLRINSDGTIPADNPFVNTAGARPEIYALGLRNPFTFAVDPVSGRMFINDVGQDTWEEVNVVAKGANYGWPTCEGVCHNPQFTDPLYTYNHNGASHAITGGVFYHGAQFPAKYNNTYFFADYAAGFIKNLDDRNGVIVTDFASGITTPVNLQQAPDGSIYFSSIQLGGVYKVAYGSVAAPPPVGTGNGLYGQYFNNTTQSGTPVFSRLDTTVNFDWGTGSPNVAVANDVFSANWTGQVQAQYSEPYSFTVHSEDGVRLTVNGQQIINNYVDQTAPTDSTGTINLVAGQKYDIKLEYYNRSGPAVAQLFWSSPSQEKEIVPQSQLYAVVPGAAPVATIVSPVANARYNAGDTINYSATATDQKDGSLPASAFVWTMIFHHATHTHPFLGPISGVKDGNFVIPTTGEQSADTYYELQLTVTNSAGQASTTSQFIYPNKATIGLASNVPGISLTLDGQPQTVPYSVAGVTGFTRNLSAPLSQTVNGVNYNFVSWSDQGAATHNITTAATDTTYTATYVAGPAHGSTVAFYAAGTPAAGVYPTAQLLVDGAVVATYTNIQGDANLRVFQTFTYQSPVVLTAKQIKISYINDAVINGQDRNLRVDKLTVDGVDYQSEDPATMSTGTWDAVTGCAPGNKQSEWLHCNGYFAYGGTAASTPPPVGNASILKIFAAGTPAQGIFPTMSVYVDNKPVSSFQNVNGDANNRVFKEYDYASPVPLNVKQLKISFDNDLMTATEDRNLRVDRIVLDGLEYQTEAPATLSTGTWDAASGCGPGNKQSEWLHCNGYFAY